MERATGSSEHDQSVPQNRNDSAVTPAKLSEISATERATLQGMIKNVEDESSKYGMDIYIEAAYRLIRDLRLSEATERDLRTIKRWLDNKDPKYTRAYITRYLGITIPEEKLPTRSRTPQLSIPWRMDNELRWILESINLVSWNNNTRIVSLDSLPKLKPIVEKYLWKRKGKTNIHHTYFWLATCLNNIFRPYQFAIPPHLVGHNSGFFFCYKIDIPSHSLSIAESLSTGFWWVDFGQSSIPRVPEQLAVAPTRVVQVLVQDEEPKRNTYNEFRDFVTALVANIQHHVNKTALWKIAEGLIGIVEVDQEGRIQLSWFGAEQLKRSDETVQEIFLWYIDWFNQEILATTK
jgi:hypothetical protein